MIDNLTSDLLFCLSIPLVLVFFVNIVTPSDRSKDEPDIIFKRVSVSLIITAIYLYWNSSSGFPSGFEYELHEHFEVSWKTMTLMILLYIGPIYNCLTYTGLPESQSTALEIKTLICAPIIEEILFRSIIITRMSTHYSQSSTTMFALTLFSLPHLHHLLHEIPAYGFASALSTALFRTVYTGIFGGLSCFLFFKYGSLLSPILAHAWCNYFGSGFVPTGRSKTEIFMFCLGLFSFLVAAYMNVF